MFNAKIHPMKIPILLLFVLFLFAKLESLAAEPWLVIERKEGIGKGQHIVFVAEQSNRGIPP